MNKNCLVGVVCALCPSVYWQGRRNWFYFVEKSSNDIAAPKTLLPKGLNIIQSKDINNIYI